MTLIKGFDLAHFVVYQKSRYRVDLRVLNSEMRGGSRDFEKR